MSAYTNFQDGDTLTAEKLNEAFGLIDTKVDLVLPAAQEAVETASQTATAVQEMSRVMVEQFARQQREIDEAVDSVADKTNKSYVDTADASILSAAKTYADNKSTALTTAYTSADTSVLNTAKGYTDDEIDDVTDAYEAADATNLAAAKTYADTQDAATLSDANDYADGVLGDAKDYADEQDATNLAAAKSYTDSAVAGVSVGRWLTPQNCAFAPDSNVFYITEEDEQPTKTWSATVWCSDPAMVPLYYEVETVDSKTAIVLKWNPDDADVLGGQVCTVHVEEVKYATV